MRAASRVLGIVGGVLGIIFAIITILIGTSILISFAGDDLRTSDTKFYNPDSFLAIDMDMHKYATIIILGGVNGALSGVLAIFGASVIKDENILGGIFMMIASFLSLFSVLGIINFIFFLLGGIFALLKENADTEPTVG